MHLDANVIDALLDGSLEPGRASALREHLAQPCEACQRALEDHGLELDTLLRLVEAEQALDESVEQPLTGLERAALWRSVEDDLPRPREAQPSRRGWRLPTLATAALALAAALVLFLRLPAPDQAYDGVKGPEVEAPAAPALELRVVTGREQAGKVELGRRVAAGEILGRDELLLFDLETDRASARYLFVVDGEGVITPLAPAPGETPALTPAGSARVASQGGWVVLDLVDMRGPLTIVGAASSLAVDPVREVQQPWRDDERRGFVAYDSLVVELAP
jgi:hypothetical protein